MEDHMATLYNAKTSNWVNLLQFYNQRFLRGRHGALTKRNSLLTLKKKKNQESSYKNPDFWLLLKSRSCNIRLAFSFGDTCNECEWGLLHSDEASTLVCHSPTWAILGAHLQLGPWGQWSLWYGLSGIPHIRKPCLPSGFHGSSSSLSSSIPALASLILAFSLCIKPVCPSALFILCLCSVWDALHAGNHGLALLPPSSSKVAFLLMGEGSPMGASLEAQW